jgi:hypothetical protein
MRHRPRAIADGSRREQQLPAPADVLMARHEGPTGVLERGKGERRGSSGTWEISTFPSSRENDGAVQRSQRATEVKPDERREVVAARSTEEAGIAAHATHRREGAAWLRNRTEERWQGHRPLRLSQRNSYG